MSQQFGQFHLFQLVSKGPEYREPNKINWKATENMIFESTDFYAGRWEKREQDNVKYVSKWKETLKKLVTDRISGFSVGANVTFYASVRLCC